MYRGKSVEYLRSVSSYGTAVYMLESAVGGALER